MNFIVKYFKDDEFLGYHISTFCQYSKDIKQAKIYTKDISGQLNTIKGNLKWLMDESKKMGKESYYKFGLDVDKVTIQHEYVNEEPNPFKIWGTVDNNGNIVNI